MKKSTVALLLTFGWLFLIMLVTLLTMGQDADLDALGMDTEMGLLIMKISQLFSVIMIFAGPAIGISMLLPDKIKFLNLHITPKAKLMLLAGLTMISALPLINFMAEWNSNIVFPESMQGIHDWIINAENKAEAMTMKFLQMDGFGDLFLNIIVIAVAAAVCEEVFFRGLMQRQLVKRIGNIHLAIWVTAILFSAMHGQFLGFIPRMILGAVLGYLYVWSGSLWVPIFGHFVNNAFAVIVAYFVNIETISPETETIGSESGEWMYVMASAIVLISMLYAVYRNKDDLKISKPTDYQT